ncbi:hypothetical protein OCC_14335 [Thermococcus litoralis DSM 5473]|uniref:Uncharacterized protein n=1 Tax=Thermococcus litoralis (strain ATCC 51850 / DSM 5473 / JCM 8560 / NS-C) TaxID=523849 RepID=S5ZTW0_THELN|nr:hypothetical protein OCC_14335 [Thermococcus litoralis DSM 5473]
MEIEIEKFNYQPDNLHIGEYIKGIEEFLI